MAFTSGGTGLYGSRRNGAGWLVISTAESRALSLAEILVHLESASALSRYVVFPVEIDESYITNLAPDAVPKNWRAEPAPKRPQILGDDWPDSRKSAGLRVPSVIVAGEFNSPAKPSASRFPKTRDPRTREVPNRETAGQVTVPSPSRSPSPISTETQAVIDPIELRILHSFCRS
jgi:RES domain-containing protein